MSTLDDAAAKWHGNFGAVTLVKYRENAIFSALLPLFLFLRGKTCLGWVQTRAETATARELAPMPIARACRLAGDYLSQAKLPAPSGR